MPTAALLGKRPSGLPMEMAIWPTFSVDESPSVTAGRSVASTWTKAKSVSVSTPVTVPSRIRAVVEDDGHVAGVADDVAVGDDQAVRVDDDARAAEPPKPNCSGSAKPSGSRSCSWPRLSGHLEVLGQVGAFGQLDVFRLQAVELPEAPGRRLDGHHRGHRPIDDVDDDVVVSLGRECRPGARQGEATQGEDTGERDEGARPAGDGGMTVRYSCQPCGTTATVSRCGTVGPNDGVGRVRRDVPPVVRLGR